jgi:hypothetical protein
MDGYFVPPRFQPTGDFNIMEGLNTTLIHRISYTSGTLLVLFKLLIIGQFFNVNVVLLNKICFAKFIIG